MCGALLKFPANYLVKPIFVNTQFVLKPRLAYKRLLAMGKFTRAVILMAVLGVPVGLAGQQSTRTNSFSGSSTTIVCSLDDRHLLTVGDRLSFRILEDEDPVSILTVTDTGELEVPYVGRVLVTGKTCRLLAAELKAALEKDYYRHATVVIGIETMVKTAGTIYIVGPVKNCGPQNIPDGETLMLSQAILKAGGFTEFAAQNKVRVTRKSTTAGKPDEIFFVNVQDVLEKGENEADIPLEAGDLIYVPTKLLNF
jgi:polysaccharide export outer membrane protein